MMKLVLVGLWVVLVALGSTVGAATYLSHRATAAAAPPPPPPLQSDKTRVLNVPMIADGAVKGFVSVQFIYTMEVADAKAQPVPAEDYLVDEAFRALYADPSLDFRHLERYDLGKLTKRLVAATNAHLGAPLVKDVLIADMNYSPKDAPREGESAPSSN